MSKAEAIIQEFKECGLSPVVVIDDPKDAVPLAKALVQGGVWIMEITFRTPAALESIRAVAKEVPEIIVGAGTVINGKLAAQALEAGAKFVVSPGFSQEVADFALEHDLAYVPGVQTMTEVMMAVNAGYSLLKVFPAERLGGPAWLKEIHSVFPNLTFMPSGGVSLKNMDAYLDVPYVEAVSGSWMCPKNLVKDQDFDQITAICKETVAKLHGFSLLHVGINNENDQQALDAANALSALLNLPVSDKGTAYFVGDLADIIKYSLPCENGHIAIQVNNMNRAVRYFKDHGYKFTDIGMGKDDNGEIAALWFDPEQVNIGGFAVHLRRK